MSYGMNLTILGNQGPYPGPMGACSGYLVKCGNTRVCVELGPGTLARLQTHVDLTSLDGLIISHYHPDHFSDILTLRYALAKARRAGTLTSTLRLVLPATGMDEFIDTYIGPDCPQLFDIVPVADGSGIDIGDVAFMFYKMKHAVESFGMTLRPRGSSGRSALGYTSDTGPCEALESLAAASRVLLSECAVTAHDADGMAAGHLWPEHIGSVAREAGTGRLMLTHFAPDADQSAVVSAASETYGAPVWCSAVGEVYQL